MRITRDMISLENPWNLYTWGGAEETNVVGKCFQ